MSKRSRPASPEICPVCGEDVPRHALACPECGADHNSGWRADADLHDALGESAEDFDYEEFMQNEFGTGTPRGIRAVWWITALLLLLALALAYFLL